MLVFFILRLSLQTGKRYCKRKVLKGLHAFLEPRDSDECLSATLQGKVDRYGTESSSLEEIECDPSRENKLKDPFLPVQGISHGPGELEREVKTERVEQVLAKEMPGLLNSYLPDYVDYICNEYFPRREMPG